MINADTVEDVMVEEDNQDFIKIILALLNSYEFKLYRVCVTTEKLDIGTDDFILSILNELKRIGLADYHFLPLKQDSLLDNDKTMFYQHDEDYDLMDLYFVNMNPGNIATLPILSRFGSSNASANVNDWKNKLKQASIPWNILAEQRRGTLQVREIDAKMFDQQADESEHTEHKLIYGISLDSKIATNRCLAPLLHRNSSLTMTVGTDDLSIQRHGLLFFTSDSRPPRAHLGYIMKKYLEGIFPPVCFGDVTLTYAKVTDQHQRTIV